MALVVPLQGPAGIFGPSCESCAAVAVAEINAEGGILGRELNLVPVDGGRDPAEVAVEVDALVSAGAVQAVTGWHISAVREAVAPRIGGRVPYAYTALYEGGENRPGVFLTGETPDLQLGPTLDWFDRAAGVRRWTIVGDDYVWPRTSAASAARHLRRIGGTVCDEMFVPLGTTDFSAVVRRVEASGCEAVLMLLIGDDAVAFNRAFSAVGLDRDVLRFSSLIEENVLLASGADATAGLMTSAGLLRGSRDELRAGVRGDPLAAVRRRRAGAQQPGGVLLRGRPAAHRADASGRVDAGAGDDGGGRRARVREPARHGRAARPASAAAGLPRGRRRPDLGRPPAAVTVRPRSATVRPGR